MADDLLDNARMLVAQDDGEEALQVAGEAMELFKKAGNADGSNAALRATILAVFVKDGSAVAMKTATEELDKAKGKDKQVEAAMLHAIGEVHIACSDGAKALGSVLEALEIYKTTSAKRGTAEAMLVEADAYSLMSKPTRALKVAQEVVEYTNKTGDEKLQAASWLAVMKARLGLGQYDNAMKAAEGAMVIYLRLNDKSGKVSTFTRIAEAQLANLQYGKALKAAGLAIETCRELGAPKWEAAVMALVVDALIKLQSVDEAVRQAKILLAYIKQQGKKKITAIAQMSLIQAYAAGAKYSDAVSAAKEALQSFREVGAQQWEAKALLEIAKLQSSMGDLDKAQASAEEALPLFKLVGDEIGQKEATDMIGAQEDAKAVATAETARKLGLKEKLQSFQKALEDRNGPDLKESLAALYADETCTTEDVEKILEPLIAKDPDGLFEFMEENVEDEEEEPKDDRKEGERLFNNGFQFDRRFLYYAFRINMMGYGPGFRLLKTAYRMGPLSADVRKQNFGISTLTYKDDMDDWEMTVGTHAGLKDCALQTGSVRTPFYDDWKKFATKVGELADDRYPLNKCTFGLYDSVC